MVKRRKKNNSYSKEEKVVNVYMLFGVTIGIVVGMMLTFATDNIIFLGVCAVIGLLIGSILGTIATKGIVIKMK